MFRSVRFANFRSLNQTKPLELARLNILLGPNNAGKSSLLYGLLMLKQTLADRDITQTLVTSGAYVDLGGYSDLLGSRRLATPLVAEFLLDEAAVPVQPNEFASLFPGEALKGVAGIEVGFGYSKPDNEVHVTHFRLLDRGGRACLSGEANKSRVWEEGSIKGLPKDVTPHIRPVFNHFIPLLLPCGPKPATDNVVQDCMRWSTGSSILAAMIANRFQELTYVAPVRERIPRYGFTGTMATTELSPTGQNLLRMLSSRSKKVIGSGQSLEEGLAHWLDKRFGLVRNVKLRRMDNSGTFYTLTGKTASHGSTVNLAAMGCGISQLVPVIVQTLLTPKSGCLLVEQPEIHLHPKAQADLADLFVDRVKQGIGQYIVETHSEHFLLRVRRRVAEGEIDAAMVSTLFVTNTRGRTRIRPSGLDRAGNITNWPREFFAEGYDEALAIAMAGAK